MAAPSVWRLSPSWGLPGRKRLPCLKDGVPSSPHFCPLQAMALVTLLRSRSFFPGRCNKPERCVWLSAYFPFCFLPHLLMTFFSLPGTFFYSNVACFCCIFQLSNNHARAGILLLTYKYMNPPFLPISPTTLCAASLIFTLKAICCRGLIQGRGFGAY